jgi:hypothetical protein
VDVLGTRGLPVQLAMLGMQLEFGRLIFLSLLMLRSRQNGGVLHAEVAALLSSGQTAISTDKILGFVAVTLAEER